MPKLVRINYREHLNARQQETYNFQKVSALLADYGFATIRLNDDWQGADFIAQHIDGKTYLKVQLKSRLSFGKKYEGKELYMAFPDRGTWYLYPHDKLMKLFLKTYSSGMAKSRSWKDKQGYTFPRLSKEQAQLLSPYRLS